MDIGTIPQASSGTAASAPKILGAYTAHTITGTQRLLLSVTSNPDRPPLDLSQSLIDPTLACSSVQVPGQSLRLDFTNSTTRVHAPSLAFRSLVAAPSPQNGTTTPGWATDSSSTALLVASPHAGPVNADGTPQDVSSRKGWSILPGQHGTLSLASDTYLSTRTPSPTGTLHPSAHPPPTASGTDAALQPPSFPRLSSKSISPLLAHCRDLVSLQRRKADNAAAHSSSSDGVLTPVTEHRANPLLEHSAVQSTPVTFPDWMATFDPTVPDVAQLDNHEGQMTGGPPDVTCVLSRRSEDAFTMLSKPDQPSWASRFGMEQQQGLHQYAYEQQPEICQQQQQQQCGFQTHLQQECRPMAGPWGLPQQLNLLAPHPTAHGSSILSHAPMHNAAHLSPTYSSTAAGPQHR